MDLPVEILLEVFRCLLRGIDHTDRYYYTLTTLRLVCSRWTHLIETTSSLWTQISSSDPISAKALVRSGTSSHLHLDLDLAEPDESSVIPLLPSLGDRWSSLKFYAEQWDATAEAILSTPASNLSSVRLHMFVNVTCKLFSGKARSLTHLELIGCQVPWNDDTFKGLRSFRFHGGIGTITMKSLLTALAPASELEELMIKHVSFFGSTAPVIRPDGTPIPFAKLKRLTTKALACDEWCQLMSSISVPRMTKLSVQVDDDVTYEEAEQAMIRVRDRVGLLEVPEGARPVIELNCDWEWYSLKYAAEGCLEGTWRANQTAEPDLSLTLAEHVNEADEESEVSSDEADAGQGEDEAASKTNTLKAFRTVLEGFGPAIRKLPTTLVLCSRDGLDVPEFIEAITSTFSTITAVELRSDSVGWVAKTFGADGGVLGAPMMENLRITPSETTKGKKWIAPKRSFDFSIITDLVPKGGLRSHWGVKTLEIEYPGIISRSALMSLRSRIPTVQICNVDVVD